jgi:hypothetical protein
MRPFWADPVPHPASRSKGAIREKSASYTILQHPEGGRKDIFSWTGAGERPLAELEIHRMGGEGASAPAGPTDLALPMPIGEDAELEAPGIIESKFDSVALLRSAETDRTGGCVGFFKRIDDPPLSLSGWTCHGESLPARGNAIGCMLDRLTLLTTVHEPKIAEMFARAE